MINKSKTYSKAGNRSKSGGGAPVKFVAAISGKRINWIVLIVILTITFIALSPALKNNFVNWDDEAYIIKNTNLTKPIGECIKYFAAFYNNDNYNNTPILLMAYAIIRHAAGLNPQAYHWVSLLMHLLNVTMVFWFVYLISGKKTEVAAFVSLFFGIHPMHVESVAWISDLKDLLYTFFFTGSMIFYYKYIANGGRRNFVFFILTFLFYIFSMFSKPVGYIFPFVLLLLDYYCGRKINKYVWLEKIVFVPVAIIFLLLTFKGLNQGKHFESYANYTVFQKLMFSGYAFVDYLIKLFIPAGLCAANPFPDLIEGRLPVIFYAYSFAALIILLIIFIGLKRSAVFTFGFLFYFLNVLIYLQFFFVGNGLVTSDRYSYLAYIGLFFIIGMGFSKLYRSKNSRNNLYKYAAITTGMVFTFGFDYLSYACCKIWKNGESLWTQVIDKYPDNYLGHNNLGKFYSGKSTFNLPQTQNDYDKAIIEFEKVASIFPRYQETYFSLGVVYKNKKDYKNAIKNFEIFKKSDDRSNPDIFKDLGYVYLMDGQFEKSIVSLDSFIIFNPGLSDVYNNKGVALFNLKKYEEAIPVFKKAIELNPKYRTAYKNAGLCFLNLKQYRESLDYFNKSKAIDATDTEVEQYIGIAGRNLEISK